MEDPAKLREPATLDFGDNPAPLVVTSLDDVVHFLDSEIACWSSYVADAKTLRAAPRAAYFYNTHLNTISELRLKIIRTTDEPPAEGNVLAILDQVSGRYRRHEVIHSDSLPGRIILKEADLPLGCAMLAPATGMPVHLHEIKPQEDLGLHMRAAAEFSSRMIRGLEPTEEGLRLSSVLELMTDAIEGELLQLEAIKDEARRVRRLWFRGARRAVKTRASLEHQSDEQLQDAQSDLEALKRSYDSHLQLKAPTDYWSHKRRDHIVVAWITGIVFVMIAAATAGSAYVVLPTLHERAMGLSASAEQADAAGVQLHPAPAAPADREIAVRLWTQFLTVGLPIFLVVWLLRIVARIWTNKLALADDARERMAMMQTYLAMNRDKDSPLDNSDRILILTALFRPSSSNSDDVNPPDWADILSARMTRNTRG